MKVRLSLCLIKPKAMRRLLEWRHTPRVFNIGTRWRLLVSPSGLFYPFPLDWEADPRVE